MEKSNAFYLLVTAIVVSDGCWHLLSDFRRAALPLDLAFIAFLPRSWLRPVPRLELGLTLGLLGALVVATVIGEWFGSPSVSRSIQQVIGRPALVIPVWLVLLWSVWQRWQRERIVLTARPE